MAQWNIAPNAFVGFRANAVPSRSPSRPRSLLAFRRDSLPSKHNTPSRRPDGGLPPRTATERFGDPLDAYCPQAASNNCIAPRGRTVGDTCEMHCHLYRDLHDSKPAEDGSKSAYYKDECQRTSLSCAKKQKGP